MRKHFLSDHTSGIQAIAAAEAMASAARTPGAKVRMVGEHAVLALGDPSEQEMQDFAAWAFGPEVDRMIECASPPAERQPEKATRAA